MLQVVFDQCKPCWVVNILVLRIKLNHLFFSYVSKFHCSNQFKKLSFDTTQILLKYAFKTFLTITPPAKNILSIFTSVGFNFRKLKNDIILQSLSFQVKHALYGHSSFSADR